MILNLLLTKATLTISLLAQLVERETVNLEASGSTPLQRVPFIFFVTDIAPRFMYRIYYYNIPCSLDEDDTS